MLEPLLLGIVQGVAEWLPVSSEGVVILLRLHVFGETDALGTLIRDSLSLHIGTFFAALVYFRRDVVHLFDALLHPKKAQPNNKRLLWFLLFSTLLSGAIGGTLLWIIAATQDNLALTGRVITSGIGILLLITAALQRRARSSSHRTLGALCRRDTWTAGIAQGFSVLPGFSRSGLTSATLLLRNLNETLALRLSFLMSLPVVLGANIVLQFQVFTLTRGSLISIAAAFGMGLLTIHLLLRFAERVNFAVFLLFFGILTIIGALLLPA